jgi:hypothetical protein
MAAEKKSLLLAIARAVAWAGVFVVFWSMNVQWGNDADAGKGPPIQFKRYVVGAILLGLVAAGALTVSYFRSKPPGPIARGVAVAGALAVLLIAWLVRRDALQDFPHLIQGSGWRWLVAGGGLILAGASLAISAPPAAPPKKSPGRRPARGRRGR